METPSSVNKFVQLLSAKQEKREAKACNQMVAMVHGTARLAGRLRLTSTVHGPRRQRYELSWEIIRFSLIILAVA